MTLLFAIFSTTIIIEFSVIDFNDGYWHGLDENKYFNTIAMNLSFIIGTK